ncbi:MAG TPA: SPOR domain-containing protein [Myxococcota bacterium]|nr:SPOR domain-containing protein [Myxococcota bacterium]
MTASRGRGLRPGGIVRAAGRLLLLIGVGFGAGLVIGILSEEPTLLAGHLRGEGESVRLGAPGERRGDDGVGSPESMAGRLPPAAGTQPVEVGEPDPARAPLEPRPRPLGREAEPRPSATASLPVVAAAGPLDERSPSAEGDDDPGDRARASARATAPSNARGTWAIQVGAFSDRSAALRLTRELREKGYPVELIPASDEGKRWRVRVQPVEGKEPAQGLAERLKREERLPTWVVSMEARSGS